VLSSTPGKAKPILRTVSKLIMLLGMGAIIRKNRNLFKIGMARIAVGFADNTNVRATALY
jgi:hypothetical protein